MPASGSAAGDLQQGSLPAAGARVPAFLMVGRIPGAVMKAAAAEAR
jgi:hypothetical protein